MNEEIMSLYAQGYSAPDLSKRFNISKDRIWYEAKKRGIKRNTKFRKRQHSINHFYFENIDEPIKAYFLGYLIADGCITKDNYGRSYLRFHCHEQDEPILEKFIQETESSHKIRKGKDGYLNLCISSQQMIEDLDKYGVSPNKTYNQNLDIPNIQYINSFVLGFLDGDGCVYKQGFIFGSTSKRLLESIRQVLPTDAKGSLRKVLSKEFYELKYGGQICAKQIYDYLYEGASFCLERKKNKLIFK